MTGRRGRAVKGETVECLTCHRYVGYWPDKLNPYCRYPMPHRSGTGLYGKPVGEWCPTVPSIG